MVVAAAQPPSPWFLPWALALFPVWWCFVLFVIAHVGGWHSLARLRPAGSKPSTGVTYHFRNGRIGFFGHYNNCLNVTVACEGLYVVPVFPFRVFHAPIQLPWSCVAGVKRRRFLSWRTLEVLCASGGRTLTLYLPTEAARFIPSLEIPPPLPTV